MQPLQGRRILVTRPAAQAGELARMVTAQGGKPVLFPLLEIFPADDQQPLLQAIDRLDDYAFALFASPNAVQFSLPLILSRRSWPATLQPVAVGPGTASQLVAVGIGRVIAPTERYDSEALLELRALQAERVAGRSLLLLRGNGGRELLADTLRQRGAHVDCVACYRRSAPADGAALLSLLRNKRLDALTVSSSEGLRNLFALLDTDGCGLLRPLPVFVPHQRIAELAADYGVKSVVLTGPADAGIVEGLCEYNWFHHE